MRDVKLRYKVLLYGLSIWQLLLFVDFILLFVDTELCGISTLITAIFMALDYHISHYIAYPDGKIKERYYENF